MHGIMRILLIIALLSGDKSYADDIEVAVSATVPQGSPFIHIVLDTSPGAFRTLCDYGPTGSCAPPFMTREAYDNLRPGKRAGEPISRLEVFSAILATLFVDPLFEQVHVSLFTSGPDSTGARMLEQYRRLGGEYAGISGAEVLREALASISNADRAPRFQAKDAFDEWYRYITGEPSPFSSIDDCSRLFSIILATESASEDLSPAVDIRGSLPIPLSASAGFTGLLDKMHQHSTDLVPGGLAGVNHLQESWVVAPSTGVGFAGEWAKAGGTGRPLSLDDPSQLEKSLSLAFSRALSLSGTTVASLRSMTSYATASHTDDLFTALFEPLSTLRWPGNVKKFKLNASGRDSVVIPAKIVDRNNAAAIVSNGDDKGDIAFDALSFWTDVVSLPITTITSAPGDADGRVVDRGGAGQKIPGFIAGNGYVIGDSNEDGEARQLFVEPAPIINGSSNNFLPFNADGAGRGSTAEQLGPLLGVSTIAEALQLIRWGRGQDVDDEDGDGIVSESRQWILGSAIHSKPVAINYGAVAGYSSDNPNVRIFFGTGDGVFHVIENTTRTGEESGREVFGFYPRELLANIALQRSNSISSLKMRYGVDGAASTFTVDTNDDGNLNYEPPDNDEAYVYFGLRRGGYSYYALDVSNPAVTPGLKWKISRTTADFGELALGFSKPVIGKVKYGDQALDVVIFAGGYHGGWNSSYTGRVGKDLNADDDGGAGMNHGNAIFIVNARTGELVWKAIYGHATDTAATASNTQFTHAGMVDSIPSAVSPLKNQNGIIHRLYVGDTGGAIWRVDLPMATDPGVANHRKERWFVSKLAELGTDGRTTDRRFFHAPDLLQSRENDGEPFDGILISSGNRARPNGTDVVNYHFYIKDRFVASGDEEVRKRPAITIGDTAAGSSLADRTSCATGSEDDTDSNCSLSMDNGWMIRMARPGEKGLSSPLLDGGKVMFTSYTPAAVEACSATVGEGSIYWVNLTDGSGVYPGKQVYSLGAGIPSAVATLGDQLLTPLGGIGDLQKGVCLGNLCASHASKLYRIYWREPGIDEL